jgi:hypothetical protein
VAPACISRFAVFGLRPRGRNARLDIRRYNLLWRRDVGKENRHVESTPTLGRANTLLNIVWIRFYFVFAPGAAPGSDCCLIQEGEGDAPRRPDDRARHGVPKTVGQALPSASSGQALPVSAAAQPGVAVLQKQVARNCISRFAAVGLRPRVLWRCQAIAGQTRRGS